MVSASCMQTIVWTQWGRDKIAANFLTTFSNGFSWMKMYEFRLKFHWSFFLMVQLTIYQHWFRYWWLADQETSHYLNQSWHSPPTHTCVTRPQWVKHSSQAFSWWRHQMETFSALLTLCTGNTAVTSEFPSQRPVTRSFDVFFDLCLNKRLSKQSSGWWFETPSCSFWRQCNVMCEVICRHRDTPVRGPWLYEDLSSRSIYLGHR